MRVRRAACRFASALRQFRRDRRGVVYIELAIAAPVLISFILTGVELTRYILIHQKVERTTATIADLVAQTETMTEAEMQGIFMAANQVMSPFSLSDVGGKVIVSSVGADLNNPPNPIIGWQRATNGTADGSHLGDEGSVATLPDGISLRSGETLITAETWYNYDPLFGVGILPSEAIYRFSTFRPRLSDLATIENPGD